MDSLDTKTGFKLCNLYRIILILGLLAILGACADVSTPKMNINGIVSKGPIGGATVTVYALNSDGTTGEILGTAITEADGSFAVEIEDYTGNVLVVSSEGQYTDEATGETKENPGLRTALDNVKETNYVAVTALTEIAARRAEGAGGLITGNIKEANAFITDMIGNIDIVSTRPADVLDPSSASTTEDEKEYGLILAGMSQMVADAVFPNISAVMTNISDDLIDDNLDQTGSDLVSAIDTFASSQYNETGLIENIINLPPIANAGTDQNVTTWSIVTLDGSGSSDADVDTLTYNWSFVSTPEGSSASLSEVTIVNPTFTADMEGVYEFALEVNDGMGGIGTDAILVTVVTGNLEPVADAGIDRNVLSGSTVTLDGSASFDPNGDQITYTWSFSSLPQGSTISDPDLSDTASVTPSFLPDVTGTYVLNLVVNDGASNSTADTVTIGVFDDLLISDVYIPDVNLKNCITSKGLTNASSLTSLSCNSMGITDVTGISEFPNLIMLHIYDNNIADLTPLASLLNLTDLRLGGAYNNLGDIAPLSALTNLTILALSKVYVSDITPLSTLVKLQHLYLSSNQITDISALSEMTSLIELSIGNNNIVDINPLAELTVLEDLSLSENNIISVAALNKLTKLDLLSLGWNQISDLTPISGLTNLAYLRLDYNQISDISPLSNLVNLENLLFPHNNIADLSPLSNMSRLTFLSFGSNYISDLSPLSNLTTLKNLYISYNQINDVGSLSGLTNLESVNLNYNAIELGVAELVTLINAANIYLSGNYNIPCADLAILNAALPGVVTAPSSCI